MLPLTDTNRKRAFTTFRHLILSGTEHCKKTDGFSENRYPIGPVSNDESGFKKPLEDFQVLPA